MPRNVRRAFAIASVAIVLASSVAISSTSSARASTGSPWVALWTETEVVNVNRAMVWHMAGTTFTGSIGLRGPGAGWAARGYAVRDDGSYDILWRKGGYAHLWHMSTTGAFLSASGFVGPFAGNPNVLARAVVTTPDGGHELLWSPDFYTEAFVYVFDANGRFDSLRRFAAPAPSGSWGAIDYERAPDGTLRLLWRMGHSIRVDTLTQGGALVSSKKFDGPDEWIPTTFSFDQDSSYDVVWMMSSGAKILHFNADGRYVGPLMVLSGFKGCSYCELSSMSR